MQNSPVQIRNFSLQSFQELNQQIYGVVNNLHYDPMRMVARINRFGGRLHKAVRVGNIQAVSFHTVMAFSWALGLANKLGVNIEKEIWERFPGQCSHCKAGPCACGASNLDLTRWRSNPAVVSCCPKSLEELQKMFGMIYPNNIDLIEAGHFMEEICELSEAVDNYTGTNDEQFRGVVISELVDVFAHLFGIANTNGVSIAYDAQTYFGNGCYSCHNTPCNEGFVDSSTVSPKKVIA